jgi:hypothetical protein
MPKQSSRISITLLLFFTVFIFSSLAIVMTALAAPSDPKPATPVEDDDDWDWGALPAPTTPSTPKATEPPKVTTPSVIPTQTTVVDPAAKKKLLGKHGLALQWISWDRLGAVTVTEVGGLLKIKGEQRKKNSTDFVTIDGIVGTIESQQFTFIGSVITQVSTINGGKACERKGQMTFKITQNRKYWRMQELLNPCDPLADYVDIFF